MFDTTSHEAAANYASSVTASDERRTALALIEAVADANRRGATITGYAQRWYEIAAGRYGTKPRLFAAGVIHPKA